MLGDYTVICCYFGFAEVLPVCTSSEASVKDVVLRIEFEGLIMKRVYMYKV